MICSYDSFHGWSTIDDLMCRLNHEVPRYTIITGLNHVVIKAELTSMQMAGLMWLKPMNVSLEFQDLEWWNNWLVNKKVYHQDVDGSLHHL